MREVDSLLALLPLSLHAEIVDLDDITEFVLDIGRPLEVRYGKRKVFFTEDITEDQLAFALTKVGHFGHDNRAGMDRTLHRVSRIVSRTNVVTGLTCRVGRPVPGCIRIIEDLIEEGHSILILGAPGKGKTTKLRDVCRFASVDLDRSVVIVDTSNEIAGDGIISHPAIGRSRRIQVPLTRSQHEVMQEAVENHTPEILVVDEIGNVAEAEACRTFAQRGVQLIATAHGRILEDILSNPELKDLVGGVKSAPISDDRMRSTGATNKFVTQRISPPTFTVVVEIIDYNTVAVHRDVAAAVDCLLSGGEIVPEVRTMVDGDWDIVTAGRLDAPVRRPYPALKGETPEPVYENERPSKGQRRNKPWQSRQAGNKTRKKNRY